MEQEYITEEDALYTFKEAMAYLRVSRATMRRLIIDKKLEGGKVGHMWRFTRAQLQKAVQPEREGKS